MGAFLDSFDSSKGLDQVSKVPSSSPSGGSLLDSFMGGASGLSGMPPIDISSSSKAESKASSSAVVDFNTGSFTFGGAKTTNMLFIVAGIVALAFLFFNHRGKR